MVGLSDSGLRPRFTSISYAANIPGNRPIEVEIHHIEVSEKVDAPLRRFDIA